MDDEFQKRIRELDQYKKEVQELLAKNTSYEEKVDEVGSLWGNRIKEQIQNGSLNPWRILPMPLIDNAFKQQCKDSYNASDVFDSIIKHSKTTGK